MALKALKSQLKAVLESLYTEGVLDHQFDQLQALQDANNPGFVVEVVTLFYEDTEKTLRELTKYLEQPIADNQRVDSYVHQLKGSSSSIGAQQIKLACIDFHQACLDNNKDGCLQALNKIKYEFYHLQSKFKTVIQ
ncbi:PREDICTED: histidine-containing phosphotransfer protein 2-like, partial [Nelumbo nucifera]|uniref:Histidine-containing phosphotransfer protein n=1 Tax=Nelumbo nucifera TaxID=4432 RepID=A0A1U8PZD6_NELNU